MNVIFEYTIQILAKHGPTQKTVEKWPVIGQFSSVGSMGKDAASWLTGEWLQSLSGTKTTPGQLGPISKAKLHLVSTTSATILQYFSGLLLFYTFQL